MNFRDRGNDILFCDGFESSSSSSSSSSTSLCRICHEEEEESTTSMESPCSCTGTLKFAHRRCIQRWCDEKGSIVCEICLQKFEPGYTVTVPPQTKPHLIDVVVTIRGSLEVPRNNHGSQNPAVMFISTGQPQRTYSGYSTASNQGASRCRLAVLLFTIILLARHLIAVLSTGAGDYEFTLTTVFLLRAAGILLPSYLVMRLISAIQNAHEHQFHGGEISHIQRMEDDLEQQ